MTKTKTLTKKQMALLSHLGHQSRTVPHEGNWTRTANSLRERKLIARVPKSRHASEGMGWLLTERGHHCLTRKGGDDASVSASVKRSYIQGTRPTAATRRGDQISRGGAGSVHVARFFAFDGGYVDFLPYSGWTDEPVAKLHIKRSVTEVRLVDLFALFTALNVWAPGFDPMRDAFDAMCKSLDVKRENLNSEMEIVEHVSGFVCALERLTNEVADLKKRLAASEW